MMDATLPRSAQIMMLVSAVAIIGVLLYYGFWAVDSVALQTEQGRATVTGKTYLEPGVTYYRQYIGNQQLTLPQSTAEQYILELDISGEVAATAIEKSRYDALKVDDEVNVTYQRRRLTGGLQVIALELMQ